jgi:chorismate mutase
MGVKHELGRGLRLDLGISAGAGGLVMAVRALRGATQVERDDRDEIIEATAELVRTVLDRNRLTSDELISIVFTTTPDLVAEFPAYAARAIGITDVPFLCASEIDVPGALPRVIRLMAFVEADFTRADARHVYLRGAQALRTDLPRD